MFLSNLFIGCAGCSLPHGLSSGCGEQGLLSRCGVQVAAVAEHGLEGAQPSVVAAERLSGCSSWALEHRLHSSGAQA